MAALAIGGGVFSAFLQVLFDKLSSPLMRHVGLMLDVEDKLRSLESTLSKIHSLVGHAEMLSVRDPGLAIWLTDIKDIARDVIDACDDFAALVQSSPNFLADSNLRHTIGSKIDKIQKRLSNIANERSHFGSIVCSRLEHQLQTREWRATSSLPTERYVLCRQIERERLIQWLSIVDGINPLAVLPVVGMGGLGKTSLVRDVYNESRGMSYFDLMIWIYVSNDFNVRRITEEILEVVSDERQPSFMNWDKLQSDLRQKLLSKRFLLVLDDVWSENSLDWERLCAPLGFAGAGSKIMITTRSSKVAGIMGTVDPLFLTPLNDEECWNIFTAHAFADNNINNTRLEEVGRQIVNKLNGVPLAAKKVGGILYSKSNEYDWMDILNNSALWRLPEYENDIMPVLRLSYQHMPPHLKLCFSFCSVFPKGYIFEKYRLVRLWMAHDFIIQQPHGAKRRIEDIGEEYFDELVCRSMFHKHDDSGDHFLLHDLMHDLAQSVSGDECVIIDDNTQKIPDRVLHTTLHFSDKFEFKGLDKHKSLRTLLYVENMSGCNFSYVPNEEYVENMSGWNFSYVPNELFMSIKYMRVLDIRGSQVVELPHTIGSLIHLRYMDLSYTQITSLPEALGNLCNLQTLLLINCRLDNLPSCMYKLLNLRNFKGRPNLLSKVVNIGRLKYLQELDMFEVSMEQGHKVCELKNLDELRGRLHISKLENVRDAEEATKALLIKKAYLHTLELQWGASQRGHESSDTEVLQCLTPNASVKSLKIRCNDGTGFPTWLSNQYLPNLEEVSLIQCRRWEELPPVGLLNSLKILEIKALTNVNMLIWDDNQFLNLEELTIRDMTEWISLSLDQIPSPLRKLHIIDCPNLRILPLLPRTLMELKLSNVGLVTLPRMWYALNEARSSSLSSLYIFKCPELTSLQEGLFEDHHGKLTTLQICSCQNLQYLPPRGFLTLTSLVYLVIENCPNLSSLPDDGGLPSSLETLRVLSYTRFISSIPSLTAQLRSLRLLSVLSISNIPCLTSLSRDILTYLINLERLSITSCEILQTMGIQVLTSLKNLVVTSCPMLTSVTDGMDLISNIPLKSIRINDCATLAFLPANLEILEQLQYLSIRDCPMIHSLPITLGNLQTCTIEFQ